MIDSSVMSTVGYRMSAGFRYPVILLEKKRISARVSISSLYMYACVWVYVCVSVGAILGLQLSGSFCQINDVGANLTKIHTYIVRYLFYHVYKFQEDWYRKSLNKMWFYEVIQSIHVLKNATLSTLIIKQNPPYRLEANIKN